MRFDVVTIFPGMFAPVFRQGVIGRAVERGIVELHAHDLRDHTHDRHRQVDDMPFGGGPGMVMKPEPVIEAVELIRSSNLGPVIITEPWGEPFDQALAAELAREPGVIIVCGRYEGIDERVYDHAREDLGLEVSVVSLGDYVLNGGEVAVLAIVEAIGRLVPGVIGNAESLVEESHEDGLLE